MQTLSDFAVPVPFGAARPVAELGDADAILRFFRAGRALATQY
jgi:hypothetical protein